MPVADHPDKNSTTKEMPPVGAMVHLKPTGKRHGTYARVIRYEKRGRTLTQSGIVVKAGDREIWVRPGEIEVVDVPPDDGRTEPKPDSPLGICPMCMVPSYRCECNVS